MRLADKVAIVTGGASGFGAGIARRFAAEGAAVVIGDIDRDGGEAVAADIAGAGGTALYQQADMSVDREVAALVGRATGDLGRLDIMVNNAGISHRNQPMLEVDEATFDRVYAVNVKSIFLAARHAVPVMRDAGGGAIVNTASTAGLRPRPGLTWYNGSKGAVITLTKSMAAELAPDRIRVNALCPVAGETPMLPTFMGEDSQDARDRFIATIPLGRLSTAEDIANAALYLASDEASLVTGVSLEIDGGRCI